MFEQTFKNIDDILHKDAGCSSELDYVEQTSWILFLKYLDDFEKDKKTAAELSGKAYAGIISPEYRWEVWAAPKGKDGKIDHHKALSGDDLKAGGRAGVVIKNTFLSNTDNASVSLRKLLLESSNLHTVLDLPGGTFTGAGVKTVVLFFEKGSQTRKVWFYQLNLDRNLGKTNPLNENDLAEFVRLQKSKADSENSWSVDIVHVVKTTYDLSVKNPHKKDEAALREPIEILDDMLRLDEESAEIMKVIGGLI